MERVTLEWESRRVGDVTLDSGRLRFPTVGSCPGIYRFTLTDPAGSVQVYVGEADQLARRFQYYRTPGASQPTNVRLNGLGMTALTRGGSMSVEIVTAAEVISADGDRVPVDLSWKAARVMVEAAALLHARAAGSRLLNL